MKNFLRNSIYATLMASLLFMAGLSAVEAQEQITIKPGYPLVKDQQRLKRCCKELTNMM